MRKSSTALAAAVVGVAMFAPLEASAQGVSIYVGPGYDPGYSYYPPYPSYGYGYPSYGYAYPSYGYGSYDRPYYGPYWGHSRRVGRRVNRRWNRWY